MMPGREMRENFQRILVHDLLASFVLDPTQLNVVPARSPETSDEDATLLSAIIDSLTKILSPIIGDVKLVGFNLTDAIKIVLDVATRADLQSCHRTGLLQVYALAVRKFNNRT